MEDVLVLKLWGEMPKHWNMPPYYAVHSLYPELADEVPYLQRSALVTYVSSSATGRLV